jgi:hypothetical protein
MPTQPQMPREGANAIQLAMVDRALRRKFGDD